MKRNNKDCAGINLFKRFLKEKGIYGLFFHEVKRNIDPFSTINQRGNDIGVDPKGLTLSIFLLHRVRNLFPPQALHPLANGLLFRYYFTPTRFCLSKAISLMFIAALTSLSSFSPHWGQIHSLSESFKSLLI